jgi:membrane-associated phospholipid phosphatase
MLPALLALALAAVPLPAAPLAAAAQSPDAQSPVAQSPATEAPATEAPAAAVARPDAASAALHAQPLAFDWLRDGLIAGGSTALWVASETVAKPALAPDTCRWCDRDPATGADRLNGFDAAGRALLRAEGSEHTMARLSDAVTFLAVPLAVGGLDWGLAGASGATAQVPEDLVMVAQAVALSSLLTQAVKFTAGRERPYVRTLTAEEFAASNVHDANVSFFSGHSSFAFSAVVAAGTVASLRNRPHQWAVWAVGLPLAVASPLLRMAADRHYASDVLVGSAMGALVGWAVPTLLHPRTGGLALPNGEPVQVSVGPTGLAIGGRL